MTKGHLNLESRISVSAVTMAGQEKNLFKEGILRNEAGKVFFGSELRRNRGYLTVREISLQLEKDKQERKRIVLCFLTMLLSFPYILICGSLAFMTV